MGVEYPHMRAMSSREGRYGDEYKGYKGGTVEEQWKSSSIIHRSQIRREVSRLYIGPTIPPMPEVSKGNL